MYFESTSGEALERLGCGLHCAVSSGPAQKTLSLSLVVLSKDFQLLFNSVPGCPRTYLVWMSRRNAYLIHSPFFVTYIHSVG